MYEASEEQREQRNTIVVGSSGATEKYATVVHYYIQRY